MARIDRPPELIFVVFNEFMKDGIISSQVVTPARLLAARLSTVRVRVVFLEPARRVFRGGARARLRQLRGLLPEGQVALYPYVGRLGPRAPALSLAWALGRRRGGPRVLHCRGPEATLHAAAVARRANARIIFDCRGASDVETRLRLRAQGRVADGALIERAAAYGRENDRQAAARADGVFAVSAALIDRLGGRALAESKPTAVVPCCIERPTFSPEARAACRRALGVDDDELLLVHVSTSAQWEPYEEVVALFREVARRCRARLMFLTTVDPSVVLAGLADTDPVRALVSVRRVAPSEVAVHLSASDLGVLLRVDDDAFRVCSPIKFGEYLGAGLLVVTSPGIGTAAEIVLERRIGAQLPAPATPVERAAAVDRLLHLWGTERSAARLRALQACDELFAWDRYLDTTIRIYGFETGAAIV